MCEEIVSMPDYFIDFNEKKYRINCDKQNVTVKAKEELAKHGIYIESDESLVWEIFHKEMNFFYVIDDADIPENGGLLRLSKTSITSDVLLIDQPEMSILVPVDENMPISMNEGSSISSEKRIPDDFKVTDDNFSHSLKLELKKKSPLSKQFEFALIDAVYEQVIPFTYYPTRLEYKNIVYALLNKYPHLAANMDTVSAMSYYNIRLTNKARNSRKRRDSTIPAVVRKKVALASAKMLKAAAQVEAVSNPNEIGQLSTTSKLKTLKPSYCDLSNYLPERPKGEDDASTLHHTKKLQEIYEKKVWDRSFISQLMDITYHIRRARVLSTEKRTSIKEIKLEFPFITDPEEVRH